MKQAIHKKILRCAIYTRKSTEHNLDLAFTSLDAQREACDAYIRSQAGEGWRVLGARYDDGAYSGASLDRPALQALLAEVRARKLDVVVVYKVDRLTRSLADFAKLIELFDAHGVSFVSTTQQFNTTSSMGRLTLNILLSFAQFEREVIGERVRDKIAASKRKGLWVGGPVPLGYAAVNKKIAIVPAEAETVSMIFARYLELGSIRALTEDLKRRGLRAKERRLSNGDIRGGGPLGTGSLTHLLRNRFYVGEVVYRGEVFSADHEPIVERPLFEAVQARLSTQAVERRCRARGLPALLAGRLFDDKGQRLTPTHSNKAGVRYRYYVSTAAGRRVRIAAPELEARVTQAMRDHLRQTGRAEVEALPDDDRELIKRYLVQVIVTATALRAEVRQAIDGNALDAAHPDYSNGSGTQTVISVPWSGATASAKGIVHLPVHNTPLKLGSREILFIAIAKARRWIKELTQGRIADFAAIAREEGQTDRHVRKLAALAFLSPRIIAAVIDGTAPANLSAATLSRALPLSWKQQEERLK